MQVIRLPQGVSVFERGWLSANNILLCDEDHATLIDSGYVKHQAQTLALVNEALDGRPLDLLVNTHLHSDHCGGNHALQMQFPNLQTRIPPGLSAHVSSWNEASLSYVATGQNCPTFHYTGILQPGEEYQWANTAWEIHAAPGHDPHSVILFAPEHKILISADALWQNGFGVVFPELEGLEAFDEVAQTLDLIERLNPSVVIPGHGSVFSDLPSALSSARSKLDAFALNPEKHARYGAKVLLKFKMMEFGQISQGAFVEWAHKVPYIQEIHQRFGAGFNLGTWINMMLNELLRSGVITMEDQVIMDA